MDWTTLDLIAEDSRKAACDAAEKAKSVDFEDYSQCAQFDSIVQNVEQLTETAFRVSCVFAKHSDDIDQTAKIWKRMTRICDDVLNCLKGFARDYPKCCGQSTYDKILDWRNEAQERYNLHA